MENADMSIVSSIKDSNKKKSSIRRLSVNLLASIVASLNVLFVTNYTASLIVVAVELLILLYYLLKKDITSYIGIYLIFLCLSFEFDSLVGTEQFYGFKNFRVFGVNLGIITLLPVLVLVILKNVKIKEIRRDFPKLYSFIRIIFFLNFMGLSFGLFQILINDNGIQSMEGIIADFIGVSYNMMAIPFLIILSITYILSWERHKVEQLSSYLLAVLIGVVVAMFVSLITKSFGQYGGVNTLLASNVIRYIPFMLVLPFYERYKSEKSILIIGIIGAFLSLKYNATGKMIILYMLVPIGIFGVLWKRKKVLPLVSMMLLLPLISIFAVQAVEGFASNSILFNVKLNQTLSILKFWELDWIIKMPFSPRTRIVEFVSIGLEYLHKPWFALFGKGYMGTVTDHTGILTAEFIPGAYSMNQWMNGTFYGVHETMNIMFLYHGFFGLFFYLYMINFVVKNFSKTPWILVGGFWFLMIYGFSVTMTAFGITALLLGYLEINTRKVDC